MSADPLSSLPWQHLEPQVKALWRIQNLISSFVTLGFALIPILVFSSKVPEYGSMLWAGWGALGVLLLGIGQWKVSRSYDMFTFSLGEEDLVVASGIFWRNWKFVSRNRVQHVDISAGPIARSLGLVEVSVYVGGLATAVVTLPGLTETRGDLIRKHLIRDRLPEPSPQEPPAPPPMAMPTTSQEQDQSNE
ncbi:PH domain-containing protein [Kamptonema cortianum]|nr:PH domain-containing protein [Geitlerinema splendidum]MDK3158875.1 PH domain-containing protein [Kamptonema cortianum]